MNSKIEEQILQSTEPIPLPADVEEKKVAGENGLWLNQHEEKKWTSLTDLSLNDQPINQDPNPERIIKIINKNKPIKLMQQIIVRRLQPPNPPQHGDLIIKQENLRGPPAPPIIIRQLGKEAPTPEALVIRERPPKIPDALPQQVITIPGKVVESSPRRVIIEKMPDMPAKPQSIIIEKWLPYEPQKRRVIFQRSSPIRNLNEKPVKNLLIEWRYSDPLIEKDIKITTVQADPNHYTTIYGNLLRDSVDVREFVNNYDNGPHVLTGQNRYDLEGDLNALKFLDNPTLEKLGLSRTLNRMNSSLADIYMESKPRYSFNNNANLQEIKLNKHYSLNGDYGLVIRGGRDLNSSLQVVKVIEGSLAALDGRLNAGDEIIQVNGVSAEQMPLLKII